MTVELSTTDVTAGNEFAIFVLVKNPFSRPVWIREVNVSLPSELKRVDEEKIQAKIKETRDKQEELLQQNKQDRTKLQEKIEGLQAQISELTRALNSNTKGNAGDLAELVRTLESDLKEFQAKLRNLSAGMSNVQIFDGARVAVLKIASQASQVQIFGHDPNGKSTRVAEIEISEPWLVYEQQAQDRTVKLASSLPENFALQSGSTAVYTVVLNVNRSLIFTPSKYRLQFYVNYGFEPMQLQQNGQSSSEESIFTNTIAHALSIRPSVYSVIGGSLIGGGIGAAARLLQSPILPTSQSVIVSLVLSMILGGMAAVFMARKSDAQSFVSVEDFWGGILMGFLVGYTGTSFFESITGVPAVIP
ncbi:MAG: hypothetical protein JXA33_08845 [Anaerolineae bacterium]|nr:hypothetical protein [Anaerolineae bacterium]